MPSEPQGIKKLVAGIVGAVVVFTGVAFLALSPASPFVAPKPPLGPAITVGRHSYVYACGVFDAAEAASILGINPDKNKQATEESFALAPDNTKDKQIDLTKLTGYKAAASSCQLKYDKRTNPGETGKTTTTFDSATLTLNQFGSEDDAKAYFNAIKSQIGENGKALKSYADSVYSPPAAPTSDGGAFIRPNIWHKNMVINVAAPLISKDTTGNRTAEAVDKVVNGVIKHIDNGEGLRPKNFNGISKLAGHPFVDTCHSVNYVTFAKDMGDQTEFDPSYISASQSFSPIENSGKIPPMLNSSCSLSYRTKTEIDSQKSMQSGQDEFSSKFPHLSLIHI